MPFVNESAVYSLSLAVMRKKEEDIISLLDRGVDSIQFDRTRWTPMHYASDRGVENILRLLLSRNPDVDIQDQVTSQTDRWCNWCISVGWVFSSHGCGEQWTI